MDVTGAASSSEQRMPGVLGLPQLANYDALPEPVWKDAMTGQTRMFAARLMDCVCLGMATVLCAMPACAGDSPIRPPQESAEVQAAPHVAAPDSSGPPASSPRLVDFKDADPSEEVRQLAQSILNSNNHRRLPFLIIDKKQAMVFAFDGSGVVRGFTAALLGMAIGDDSAPGIGQRKLSAIGVEERTTPAGRFVAALDRNLHDVEILWVDYDAAISLHRVVTGKPAERRAQRLASPTPFDNRISYGCINVPAKFFDEVVKLAFDGTNGIVYVLPETRAVREVFGFLDARQAPAADSPPTPAARR